MEQMLCVKDTEPFQKRDFLANSIYYNAKYICTYCESEIYYYDTFLIILDLSLAVFAGFIPYAKGGTKKFLFVHSLNDGALLTYGSNVPLSVIIKDCDEANKLRRVRSAIQALPCKYVSDTKFIDELIIPYMQKTVH